jgi:hypothetical protein
MLRKELPLKSKPGYDSKGKSTANPFDSRNLSPQKRVIGSITSSICMEDRRVPQPM